MNIKIKNLFFACLTTLVFGACDKKEGCTDSTATNFDLNAEKDCCCEYTEAFTLQMHFHAFVGSEILSNGNTYTINGVKTKIDNARFYVSNIRLVNDAGEEIKADGKYLLVDPEIEEYEIGEMPLGNYTKIRFDIGIDSTTNHSADPSNYAAGEALGYQSPGMNWGWTFGYMFVLVHGEVDSDGDAVLDDNLIYHLGTDAFLVPIEIDYPLDANIDGNIYVSHLSVNWAEFFGTVDLATENHTEVTDNPALANKLLLNIPNMISIEE